MNKPLVTVLVVTYNHINTFEKAIESVLEQKTDFDFKIWVLDDASTDGSSDLVRKYAEKYPDKIVPFIRPQNLGGLQNVYQALEKIDTKYFATLESDDYWCDENKLQLQVDILEKNPDCSFCCHNSYRRYPQNEDNPRHNTPYINLKAQTGKYSFPKSIFSNEYIEPHYSSRMYRTDCLNLDKVKNPIIVCYDIASMFWFLDKGKMYYINKFMSVYNYNYNGVYSGIDSNAQNYRSGCVINDINCEFDYKYNSMFLDFFKIKIPVPLFKGIYIRYFAKKDNLNKIYKSLLENFYRKLDSRINKRTLFEFYISLGKKKRLVFEIRREKDV